MSIDENSNDSNWNIIPLKKENESDVEKIKPVVKPKENRKFCEKWLSLFSPWLSRCEDDPNRPYCRACQRPLDNNRFRLQRHERTAKHARNQEILLNQGEDAVRLLLTKTRRRYIKKEAPMKLYPLDIERTSFENEIPFKKIKTQKLLRTPTAVKNGNDSNYVYPKRECHDMSDYYYTPHNSRPPPPKKDSFDMFFEAISATVKNLPPKLAAEVKSRVSQVIAEFELRAICEKEAREKAQQSVVAMAPQVANVVTIDPVITAEPNSVNVSTGNQQTTHCTPTVTQYVYAYQQKKEIN
ncbi:uncharacterized protein LOC119600612 [Lucilia sericata]|uniref:uncharacterized protein LOC119600612 n=1 Tax=Lucilia sericata TaxID=13632 RepID=UPI0018A86917|nr:uncharacterized protein LOC119600612 [Lucilia sericata]